MKINWVDDDAAKVVLSELGIECVDKEIPTKAINKTLSAQNRARKIPLDETRVDGVRSSMKKGVPIPKIVVRDTRDNDYVIVGGNHRFAGVNGEPVVPVHSIDCTDHEFEVAVRVLNTVVGEGITKSERVESAVDAVSRLGLTQKQACEIYGVTKGEIQGFIENQKAEGLLASLNVKGATRLTKTHIKVLGELSNNTNVLRAAVQSAVAGKLTVDELRDLARVARGRSTEAAQVRVFEEMSDVSEKSGAVVPRKIKKRFLIALNGLRGLTGSKTWESLEMKADEIEVVRVQVKEVRDMLNCLLKADG